MGRIKDYRSGFREWFGGGRQQGKTEKVREMTMAAIEDGKQIYMPKAPSITDDTDPDQPS